MLEIPVSTALKDLLDRKGMRSGTAGTVTTRGIKTGERNNALYPQLPAGEEISGIKLVWENPTTLRQRVTHTRSLKLVCSQ